MKRKYLTAYVSRAENIVDLSGDEKCLELRRQIDCSIRNMQVPDAEYEDHLSFDFLRQMLRVALKELTCSLQQLWRPPALFFTAASTAFYASRTSYFPSGLTFELNSSTEGRCRPDHARRTTVSRSVDHGTIRKTQGS